MRLRLWVTGEAVDIKEEAQSDTVMVEQNKEAFEQKNLLRMQEVCARLYSN